MEDGKTQSSAPAQPSAGQPSSPLTWRPKQAHSRCLPPTSSPKEARAVGTRDSDHRTPERKPVHWLPKVFEHIPVLFLYRCPWPGPCKPLPRHLTLVSSQGHVLQPHWPSVRSSYRQNVPPFPLKWVTLCWFPLCQLQVFTLTLLAGFPCLCV